MVFFAVIAANAGCNSSSLSGTSAKQPRRPDPQGERGSDVEKPGKAPEATPRPSSGPKGGGNGDAVKNNDPSKPSKPSTPQAPSPQAQPPDAATDQANVSPKPDPQVDSGSSVVPPASPTNTQPDSVVDGMEVFDDSDRCIARAKELSPKAGFQADVSKTVNLGFYKIEESKGLCDVHFLAETSVEIANHEGKDSVLNRQIALYCPCKGPWAKNEGNGEGGGESEGGFEGSGEYFPD